MEEYYKKIRKRSILPMLAGVAIMLFGTYFIYMYTVGPKRFADDRLSSALIASVFLLVGMGMLISASRNELKLKKLIQEAGLSEGTLAADLESGVTYKNCTVGQDYALDFNGNPTLVSLKDAVLVHQKITSSTRKGITSYTYHVVLIDKSGKEFSLQPKDEDEMAAIAGRILEHRPWMITEMDKAIKELVRKNPQELVRIAEERKVQYESDSK